MVSVQRIVGLSSLHLDGYFRWISWDQPLASPDQFGTSCLDQGIPNREVILRLQELHHGALHFPVVYALGNVDLLLGEGVNPRVVKTCRDV